MQKSKNRKMRKKDFREEGTHLAGTRQSHGKSEEVEQNREQLLDLCRKHNLIIVNTQFAKPQQKLITWKTISTREGDEMDRGSYDQIDFVLTPHRWRNGVKDAESHPEANIDSDHFPVVITNQFKYQKH